jgi:hypothetical protein
MTVEPVRTVDPAVLEPVVERSDDRGVVLVDPLERPGRRQRPPVVDRIAVVVAPHVDVGVAGPTANRSR